MEKKANVYSTAFMIWVAEMNREASRCSYCYFVPIEKGYVVVDKRTGKTAMSKCHPDDNFDYGIGRAIAYARLQNIKIPTMEKRLTIGECVGKVVTISKKEYYVTPISHGYNKNGEFSPDKFLCIKISKPYIISKFSCLTIDADVEIDNCREITLKSVY